MEDDFKEEIIVEEDDFENNKEEEKKSYESNKQIVITKDSLPFILSIISVCLTFFKTLFTVILSYSSYNAMVVLYSIFFAGAVACALASLIIILIKNRKVAFTPEFVFSVVAIAISFI